MDLGVKRRLDLESGNGCPLEVYVEEAVHAVRRSSKLAASVNTEDTQRTEHPLQKLAPQQGTVAEVEVIRAQDHDS